MKRLLCNHSLVIVVMLLLLGAVPVFAENTSSPYDDSSTRSTDITFSAGFRASFLLGFEPEVSVCFNNIEISAFAPLDEGFDSQVFGWGAGVSLGVNSKPHGRGWQNGFGISYLFLSPSFFDAKGEVAVEYACFEEEDDVSPLSSDSTESSNISLHIASLYYRGGVKFTDVWGLYFRIFMPVFLLYTDGSEYQHISMLSTAGATLSLLSIPCSISLGVRFEF